MTKRPTLADLAGAAGVSIATVDRVLNARHRVREPTAKRVLGAAEAIGFHAAPLLKRRLRAETAARLPSCRGRAVIEYVTELVPATIAEALVRLGEVTEAIGVVSVDHPRVSEEIARLADRGKP